MNQVWWLLRFARRSGLRLGASTLARLLHLCLGAGLLALPAWWLGRAALAQDGQPEPFGPTVLVVLLAVMAVMKAGLRYAEQLLGHLAAFHLMGELRVWTLEGLVPRAPAVVDGPGSARVQAIAHRDVDRIEVFFAHTIAPALTAVAVPVLAVAAAFPLAGARCAGVLALVLLAGIVLPLLGARAGQRAAERMAATRTDIAQHLSDTMRCHPDVLALQAQDHRMAQLGALDDQLAGDLRASGRAVGLRQAASTLRVWLGSLLVLLAGIPAVGEDLSVLPGVLTVMALVPGTAAALESVERLARSLPAGLEATRGLRELVSAPPAVPDLAQPETEEPAGDVAGSRPASAALHHVDFSYPGRDEAVLAGIELAVGSGEVVGVCGATGSGKSTLARLLQRWYDPEHGEVSVDGQRAYALPLARLRQRVVIAQQSPDLFDDTIRANLLLGAPDATNEQVSQAVRASAFDQTLGRLPGGLETPIGPGGARLSGGERQRLALARALLRAGDDALLVLDEATSHQDPLTQQRMLGELHQRRGGTLVVAHRLETLRHADRIVVLEAGRVAESGGWDELVSRGGAFAALLNAQH